MLNENFQASDIQEIVEKQRGKHYQVIKQDIVMIHV